MNRDRSLDIGKGLAILFVYLGHSILYHPIEMANMYGWCHFLERVIVSFNMPMFFIISGYLFSKTKKSTGELYKGKTLRMAIPYLTTMAIIIGTKLILPQSMSYNAAVSGGGKSLIINALLYGGDRWFVYALFIIYLVVIPFRDFMKKKWLAAVLMIVCIVIHFMGVMPSIFELKAVVHYTPFFLAGICLNEYYPTIKAWSLKYWWLVYLVFILGNGIFVLQLNELPFVFRYVLPFTGTLAVMTMAFQMEKAIENSKVYNMLSM